MVFGEGGGLFFVVLIGVVTDEIGAEEVQGEGEPENPFAISIKEAFFL